MVPLQMVFCPLAAIGISGIYAALHRLQLSRRAGPDRVARERVAYMLWKSASRF